MRTSFASRAIAAAASVAALGGAARAASVPYAFTLNPGSGLTTTAASVQANAAGTLIGAYDAATNPAGTRTKPGLFGSFGDTENQPVDMTALLNASGTPAAPMGGTFTLLADTAGGAATLSSYAAQLSGPAVGALSTSATVTTSSFRTRNPTSTYPGGVPITLPIGTATVTSLSIVQKGGAATGTLVPTATPGDFTLTVSAGFEVTVGVNLAGSDLVLGPVTTVLPLEGTLHLDGTDASLSALSALTFTQSDSPALPLPAIPFDLPTVLPPGGTASILLNLTLNSLATTLEGSLSTNATGTAVPEPAVALAIFPLFVRRRR